MIGVLGRLKRGVSVGLGIWKCKRMRGFLGGRRVMGRLGEMKVFGGG